MPPTTLQKAVFWLTATTLAGLAIFAAWSVYQVIANPCRYDMLQRSRSPDGARQAVVAIQNCGATTPFMTMVLVTKPGRRLPNAIHMRDVAMHHAADPVLTIRDRWAVGLNWQDSTHLTVHIPTGARVAEQGIAAGGVQITIKDDGGTH